MGEEYRAKAFKSGNSVALRLPKALGVVEGDDMIIVPHAGGGFTLWREKEGAKVLDSLYGAFSAGFMAEGRGDTEQSERDWSEPGHDRAA